MRTIIIFILMSGFSYLCSGAKYTYTTDSKSVCPLNTYQPVTFSISENSTDLNGFKKKQNPCCHEIVLDLNVTSGSFDIQVGTGSLAGSTWGDLDDAGDIPIITTTATQITIGNLHLPNNASSEDEWDEFMITVFVRCTATGSAFIHRNGGGTFKIDGKTTHPKANEHLAELTSDAGMSYISSTTTQGNTNNIGPNSTNGEIIGIEVLVSGFCSPFNITQFDLNTNGTTNASADLLNASIYYTGNSPTFSTTSLFGSFANPNGAFVITGSQSLVDGTNYFWLTYDLPTGATINNLTDGECTSITLDGGLGAQIPSVTSPAGTRTIAAFFSRNGGGDWELPATWSLAMYNGVPAASIPGPLDDVFIGDGDVVTVRTKQDGTPGGANIIRVEDTGELRNTAGSDIWVTNDIFVTGSGILTLDGKLKVQGNSYFNGTGTSIVKETLHFRGDLTVSSGSTIRQIGDKDINIGENDVSGDLILDGLIEIQGNKDVKLKCTCSSTIDGTGSITSSDPATELRLEKGNRTFLSTSNISTQAWVNIKTGITVTNNGTVNTIYNGIAGQGGINVRDDGGIWINAANSTLNYGGADELLNSQANNKIRTLNASANGNIVNYNSSLPQSIIVPATSYFHLQASTSNTKTTVASIIVSGNLTSQNDANLLLGGGIDINGNVIIQNAAQLSTSGNTINLAGNWTNTSSNSDPFVESTGLVVLDGVSSQSITNSNGETFNDLNIDNSEPTNAILLGGVVTVNGTLTLTSGHIITTATNILKIGGNAATPVLNGTPQENSFIKGPMIHVVSGNASTTKVFPIGKSTSYRRVDLTIDHGPNVDREYRAEMFHGDANLLGYANPIDVTHVSRVRYFEIEQLVTTSLDNAQVRIYYSENGISDVVTDTPNLSIVKDDGATNWINLGGTAAGSPNGDVLSGSFTTFSKFALANDIGGANPLPIELTKFTAVLSGNHVDLNWETSTEINNDYFTIERSINAIDFEELERVDGAGNSNEILKYDVIDINPHSGISYYRLKQTDYDGNFTYSSVVPVELTEGINSPAPSFSVYPNPSTGERLSIKNETDYSSNEEILVVVIDLNGRELYSRIILTDSSGQFNTAIDPYERIPPGMYIVMGSSNDAIHSEVLIIESR